MKYIRTKDGIFEVILISPLGFVRIDKRDGTYPDVFEKDIIAQADTIEELCDEFVVRFDNNIQPVLCGHSKFQSKLYAGDRGHIMGAIWTDKGLIYVAKMNDKGELELL